VQIAFIFLIGWFDTRGLQAKRQLCSVYIPHWLIRYLTGWLTIRAKPCLYSSLVDSIRGWSRRPHGELHVYIPHWLIRYTFYKLWKQDIFPLSIFLIGWFDTRRLGFGPSLWDCLYSSLVDSIQNNNFFGSDVEMFIFLIGWFDTKPSQGVSHNFYVYIPHWLIRYKTRRRSRTWRKRQVYIPHWLIRYRRSSGGVWSMKRSLYSSLVDSIHH